MKCVYIYIYIKIKPMYVVPIKPVVNKISIKTWEKEKFRREPSLKILQFSNIFKIT